MNRRPVRSSNVTSVGWEADPGGEAGTLEVEFKSGHIYAYSNVPASEYQALLGASSVGKYLNQHIIGRYAEERVS